MLWSKLGLALAVIRSSANSRPPIYTPKRRKASGRGGCDALTMTSSDVEFVRSIIASWSQGDYSSSGWADPEIELVIADGPEPGVWTGRAGLAAAAREFLSPLADTRAHADELRELDNGRVLALLSYTGRGKASGLEVDARIAKGAWLFHVVDERVRRVVRYWDRDRAFADLGHAPE